MRILVILIFALWTFCVPLHNLEAQETSNSRALSKEVKAAIQRSHRGRLQDIPDLFNNRNVLGVGKNYIPVSKSMQSPEEGLQHLSMQSPPNPLEQILKNQTRLMNQSAQAYRIDTVIERGTSDTSLAIFTYYPNGVLSFGSSTIFPYRQTHTYDASGREITSINLNWANGQWTISFGDSVTYDTHGNVLTWVYSPWLTPPGQLFSYDTYAYSYDARGNPVLETGNDYQSGVWASSWSSILTYDANGNQLGYLITNVDSSSGQPDSTIFRGTNTYDTHGNLLTSLREQEINIQNNLWVPEIADTFTYDANGKVIRSDNPVYTNGQLSYKYIDTYTYDAHGNALTYAGMEVKAGQLVYQDTTIDTYDANGQALTESTVYWEGGQLLFQYTTTLTYNANAQVLTNSYVEWDYGQLTKSLMSSYTYNANGNMDSVSTVSTLNSLWVPADGSASAVVAGHTENFSGYNIIFKYELAGITSVSPGRTGIPNQFSLLQNYPNPFNPTTTIKFTVQGNGFTSLKVYNVLGQVVATLVNAQLKAGSYEKTFDARNLASGVYMYRLQSGQFNEVKKLMVLK
jgi:hypothetical protein